MSAELGRRVVVSVSLSRRTEAGAVIAEALDAAGISLRHAGPYLLAWAAAYLSGAAREQATPEPPGISDAELDAALDDW